MNRYELIFNKLNSIGEKCFVPFVILGDPSIKISLKIIDTLIENGADALELGIPFSDPIADGIVVQRANLRAFSSGIQFLQCFNMLEIIRKKYSTIPIGLLVYANLIFNNGINSFYKRCSNLDIDSVLIADVPIEESAPFRYAASINKILPIFMCPPNADDILIDLISLYGKGYIYLLSRSGVTGIKKNSYNISNNVINIFKKKCSIPLLQGFGISNEIQIKRAISSGVSGVICGSVIIELIEKNFFNEKLMLKKIKKLVVSLKNATKNT